MCSLPMPPLPHTQRLLKYYAGYNEDMQLVRLTAPLALKLTRSGKDGISSKITVALFLPFDIQVGGLLGWLAQATVITWFSQGT